MTNYREAILSMIDKKENRKKELLAISDQLKTAMGITDDDVQLIRNHDVGFQFPLLELSIRCASFEWNDWKALLVVRPMANIDQPPLQWTYIPDDEVLEGLVKELSGNEKSRLD
jgi:hypothetical protein